MGRPDKHFLPGFVSTGEFFYFGRIMPYYDSVSSDGIGTVHGSGMGSFGSETFGLDKASESCR